MLDGGLKKWKLEKKPLTNSIPIPSRKNYNAKEKNALVKDKEQINQNIIKKKFIVVDARSRGRFDGKDPEPRKNVRSGSIPNSLEGKSRICPTDASTRYLSPKNLFRVVALDGDSTIIK